MFELAVFSAAFWANAISWFPTVFRRILFHIPYVRHTHTQTQYRITFSNDHRNNEKKQHFNKQNRSSFPWNHMFFQHSLQILACVCNILLFFIVIDVNITYELWNPFDSVCSSILPFLCACCVFVFALLFFFGSSEKIATCCIYNVCYVCVCTIPYNKWKVSWHLTANLITPKPYGYHLYKSEVGTNNFRA